MKNEIKICDNCKYINLKTIIPKIRQLDEACDIKIGCNRMCAICKSNAYLIKNGILISAPDEDKLIEKLKRI